MTDKLREQFEEWLGREDCPVHYDESANKNAWYGYAEGYRLALASYAPSEDVWSQCPRCDNGIYNGKECAICYGTGRVTESLLAREAAAKPPIDDISVICAEIEHNDH